MLYNKFSIDKLLYNKCFKNKLLYKQFYVGKIVTLSIFKSEALIQIILYRENCYTHVFL